MRAVSGFGVAAIVSILQIYSNLFKIMALVPQIIACKRLFMFFYNYCGRFLLSSRLIIELLYKNCIL